MIEDVFYFHTFFVMFTSSIVDIFPQTWVLSGLILYGSKTQISFQLTDVDHSKENMRLKVLVGSKCRF